MAHSIQRKSNEYREQLIDQLISHRIYKKNGKHLFQLTLEELEQEYERVLSTQMRCS
ncbi:Fur-regulated basic protein FbpA [Sporolactobacillus shoreicorticis]|uniref:Fur-regulated basic protein FbpA n=1 Tax=Sporolactobacillus shoreicorticis TaxID=1923877 RepID=A0ABW5S3U9_9BACL|nr:Fur-regulated basic protein FbpA [Sporolactobacillus shoreicorticis]MCO7124349.1 Fur-regulated basic protein FbpA [Sporolactobacillus shoreicorticis]